MKATTTANRTRFLLQVLFALYVLSTSVLAFNSGTSWLINYAFAALKEDGTVAAWGDAGWGGSGVPEARGLCKGSESPWSMSPLG